MQTSHGVEYEYLYFPTIKDIIHFIRTIPSPA
jgi:hypothetical protein